jgi:hypothetical protein
MSAHTLIALHSSPLKPSTGRQGEQETNLHATLCLWHCRRFYPLARSFYIDIQTFRFFSDHVKASNNLKGTSPLPVVFLSTSTIFRRAQLPGTSNFS